MLNFFIRLQTLHGEVSVVFILFTI